MNTNFFETHVLSYLRTLAKIALKKHNPTIIGIAGSVGKSSTRYAIEAILKDHYNVKSIGNSETGIPLGILGIVPKSYGKKDWALMLSKAPLGLNYLRGTQYLIAEMGIDEPDPPKNMEYLLTILKPNIAVSLNVSATHSQQFDKTVGRNGKELSDKERLESVVRNIAKEDTKIITDSGCKVGIYNADDENLSNQISERFNLVRGSTSHTGKVPKLLTFGTKNKNAVSYGIYSVSLEGSNFQLFVEKEGKNQEIKLKFKGFIVPEVYREVFAASILTALSVDLTLDQIKSSLQKNFTLPKSRSSLFEGIRDSVIIDSTYNASKQSTIAFLDLLDTLENKTDRPTVFVFGDMRELGKESEIEHTEVAKRTIGTVDYLYLVGPQTMEYVLPIVQENEGKFKEIRWFDSANRVGEYLKDNLPHQAIALFKGSQNTIFLEEAVKNVLLNKKDANNLCRQSDFWMNAKNK